MKKNNFILTILMGLFFFMIIAYSMIYFNNTVNYELEKSVKSTLAEMADQQQLSINRQLESMVFSIQNMAETLPVIGVNEEEILNYVYEKKEQLEIQQALIVDMSGIAYSSVKGDFTDMSENIYIKEAFKGISSASEPYMSENVGKEVVMVAVPIYVNDVIDGVLAVEYCTEYLGTLLTAFTDNRGLNLIVNADSEIMISTNEFVLSFDAFKSSEFEGETTFESVVNDFKEGNSGSISYEMNGIKKFGEYRQIEINEWILFFEISEESVTSSVQNISNQMILTSAIIIFFAFVVITYVIVDKNNAAKELEKVAYYDELTEIPNMVRFKMLVSEAISKQPNKNYIMVKMDMINFKAVNEMFGYDLGNKVIKAIANTGTTVQNTSFIQARVASDEFMFFAECGLFNNLEQSSIEYEKRFKILVPELEEHQFTFRYGRYFIKPGETDINAIIHKTNIAHSYAKKDNTLNIWNYDDDFSRKVLRSTEIANKMSKALTNEEFKLFLQPKYNFSKGVVSGAEALVRWVEPDGKMVFPNDFIPLFEQNGFIVELDKYMLKKVCVALKSWEKMGKEIIPISVNFSRLHMRNKKFVKEIKDIVESFGVNTKDIEIELTESTVMENEKAIKSLLKQIHDAGFLASIDDFGSGYSSLGMLKNFDVDTLKLDRSFFVELEDEEEKRRGNLVVENIISLASDLGMYTVAEGIEEKHQEDFLKRIKCDAAQGYYYAKPMPVDDFEKKYLI